MIPELYSSTSTASRALSLTFEGALNNCVSCKVREKVNDDYSLVLTTIVTDPLTKKINTHSVIRALANPQDDPQLFVVFDIEKDPPKYVVVYAKHIRDILFHNFTTAINTPIINLQVGINGNPEEVWKTLKDSFLWDTPFTLTSNYTSSKLFKYPASVPQTAGDLLFKKDGSFIDVYPCDFHWDNYNVFFGTRGRDTGYTVMYGKNISTAKQTESSENEYTHIYPYGKIKSTLTGNEVNVIGDIYYIENSTLYYKAKTLDCSEAIKGLPYNEETLEGLKNIRTAMTEYIKQYIARNNVSSPSVNITVDIRATLDDLKDVSLCDTVYVILDDFGTQTKAKVVEVVFDSLLERWDKLQLGESTKRLCDVLIRR